MEILLFLLEKKRVFRGYFTVLNFSKNCTKIIKNQLNFLIKNSKKFKKK